MAVRSVQLPIGSIFASRYEIVGELGRGGMSVVFDALDRERRQAVALKVLSPDIGLLPEMARRFACEIPAAARIRQPNVCHIYAWGQHGPLRYIAMERVSGHDLGHVLARDGAFPARAAFDLALQIARGVQALHGHGILHRDIKPRNVMCASDGRARLMDFDIAKHCADGAITHNDAGFGTPEYASPEQALGHAVDFRSDLYSLGVVIFEIFAGVVPFRGPSAAETTRLHRHAPPPLDGPDAPPLPATLVPILRRALAKRPHDRYKNVKGLAEALRLARAATPRDVPGAVRRPSARRVSPTSPTLTRALPALLSALNERDETRRPAVARTSRPLDPEGRQAILTLLDTLVPAEEQQHPQVQGVRALIQALGDPRHDVRREASDTLTAMAASSDRPRG